MIQYDRKRLILLCGHYGSGKTNVAVHWALQLAKAHRGVRIADLDIVNPYYRTKDSMAALQAQGVELIASNFANTNVDLPALPQGMYALCDDRSRYAVVDVGGDDRGALALGRLTPAILEENNYEMLLVINRFRPLTTTVEEVLAVKAEIEAACGIACTALLNNSNLGAETTPELVRESLPFARAAAQACGLPLRGTAVHHTLVASLAGEVENLLPLCLQKRPIDL